MHPLKLIVIELAAWWLLCLLLDSLFPIPPTHAPIWMQFVSIGFLFWMSFIIPWHIARYRIEDETKKR
jgi:hypothetical protein